jgi:hypothetical protein
MKYKKIAVNHTKSIAERITASLSSPFAYIKEVEI